MFCLLYSQIDCWTLELEYSNAAATVSSLETSEIGNSCWVYMLFVLNAMRNNIRLKFSHNLALSKVADYICKFSLEISILYKWHRCVTLS